MFFPDVIDWMMQNKPFHSAFEDAGSGLRGAIADPGAGMRISLLGLMFGGIAAVVLCRLVWVQTQLQDRYLDALSITTIEYEVIPARDGRILTETSEVLAADIDVHRLQIHYRWLQDPIDDRWLNRQIRKRLTSSERKDDALVDSTKAEVLQERRALWRNLILTTGIDPQDFRKRQLNIQNRVQRIADSVNERRSAADRSPELPEDAGGFLMRWATAVREALTESPRRQSSSRIAVREEESYHDLLNDVPLSVVASVEERRHLFPGIRAVTGNQRSYPEPNVAPHLVGARRQAASEAGEEGSAATEQGERRSRALFGVEQSYDHVLQGIPGRRKVVRNRRYEILETEVERDAVAGRDVTLTINFQLQQVAQQLLADALEGRLPDAAGREANASDEAEQPPSEPQTIPLGGCVVVVEVQTGRVVVAASEPSFSLNLFTGASRQEWDRVNQDGRHPFLFRAIQMEIPPGSAVKPLTAVAAMSTEHLDPDQPFRCQGFLETPDQRRCLIYRLYGQSHGEIRLKEAMSQSCNVYFFDAAQRMGTKNLSQWFGRFGLGRPTGIDLPSERSGQLPEIPSTLSADRQVAMGMGIGQNRLTVTPLQVASAIAAIANGGFLVTPHVVGETGAAHRDQGIDTSPRIRKRTKLRVPSAQVFSTVQEGMDATVQSVKGTAYKTGRISGAPYSGKTGTAQTGPGRNDHAWFVGYAPSKQPQYAFAVVLEHGGSGSRMAVPVARELLQQMVVQGLLP